MFTAYRFFLFMALLLSLPGLGLEPLALAQAAVAPQADDFQILVSSTPLQIVAGEVVPLNTNQGQRPSRQSQQITWEVSGDYEVVSLIQESGQTAPWRTRKVKASGAKDFFTTSTGPTAIKGVKPGRAILKATLEETTRSAPEGQQNRLIEAPPIQVTVSPTPYLRFAPALPTSIAVGEIVEVTAIAKNQQGKPITLQEVTWQSQDLDVLALSTAVPSASPEVRAQTAPLLVKTQDKVYLKGLTAGTAVLRLTGGGVIDQAVINVYAPPEASASPERVSATAPTAPQSAETTAPAQVHDKDEVHDDSPLLTIRRGEQKTLVFAKLVQVAVRNTNIINVREVNDKGVTIVGVGAGETWLEATHGEHQWTAVRVRVLASPTPTVGPDDVDKNASRPTASAPPTSAPATPAPLTSSQD
ncbi:MAG: hypothetical protein M3347_02235, partial [Armatimonadota bacterium]|nr:hypothetical protein [Armatimonadota bacterium]